MNYSVRRSVKLVAMSTCILVGASVDGSPHKDGAVKTVTRPHTIYYEKYIPTLARENGLRGRSLDADMFKSASDDEDDEANEKERCIPIDECELCLLEEEGCAETGRRRKFECTLGDNRRKVYNSCLRTTADEQWLVVRMQFFCAMVFIFSMISTRKQKIISASLFDQRKRRKSDHSGSYSGLSGVSKEANYSNDTDLEMQPLRR